MPIVAGFSNPVPPDTEKSKGVQFISRGFHNFLCNHRSDLTFWDKQMICGWTGTQSKISYS